MLNRAPFFMLLGLGLLAGCTDVDKGDDADADTGGLSDGDGGTGDDSDTEDPDDTDDPDDDKIQGMVNGTVTVQVWETVDGEFTQVDVNDRYGGDYPFGKIFVGAYDDPDDSGRERYRGIDTLDTPTFGPDPFELEVRLDEAGKVVVYAVVDADGDAVIDTQHDATGLWPFEVMIEPDGLVEDIEITVAVNLDKLRSGGGSGCCGDGTSDGCTVTVSGEVDVGRDFDGNGLAMILGSDGSGPYYADWFEASSTSGASGHDRGTAEADYSITMCHNTGTVKLVGAIDSNDNGIIDPDDTTGAYVTSPDENGNPINVATADLSEHTIQIPIFGEDGEEEFNGVQLVPFVRLTGEIHSSEGTFDDFGAGTRLYVAALKYRPNTSVNSSTFASGAYDQHIFEWSELAGQASVSYEVIVPANTAMYLWAFADPDLDGTLNEAGEPVASANNSSTGEVTTGSDNLVFDMVMGVP